MALGSVCRLCHASLKEPFLDLGAQPACESYLDREGLEGMEMFFPLRLHVCDRCRLVQLKKYIEPTDIFSEYAYFSSYSTSWLKHSKVFVDMAVDRFALQSGSLAVELGSNDGYLLQYFREHGVEVLGIEPAQNVAQVAIDRGIPTLVEFFGVAVAQRLNAESRHANLVIGNNVLAQVPDVHDFVEGLKLILGRDGVITIEFPHVLRLLEGNQFDTIYHEHFSYFSLATVDRLFAEHELRLFDVEELSTHGGSLRVYACHQGHSTRVGPNLAKVRESEQVGRLALDETYESFAERVEETKWKLLEFLIDAKRNGKQIVGYGAAGKGNTLMNYCGIRSDFLDYVVDRNSYKQGKFLPGTHIPIHHPDKLETTKPDYVLILAWNVKTEITEQISYIRDWGGTFVVPIPEVQVFDGLPTSDPKDAYSSQP